MNVSNHTPKPVLSSAVQELLTASGFANIEDVFSAAEKYRALLSTPGPDCVSRASALAAIDYLDQSNSPGRSLDAREMLVEVSLSGTCQHPHRYGDIADVLSGKGVCSTCGENVVVKEERPSQMTAAVSAC